MRTSSTRQARPEVEIVDAGHGEHGQPLTHASRAKLVVRAAKAHPRGLVVRLMDGDPATFNGLAEEAAACVKAGVPFEVVPGVSAVSAVPTYAGVPLTTTSSRGIHIITAGEKLKDIAVAIDPSVTVVVLGQPDTLVPRPSKHCAAPVAPTRRPSPSPSAAHTVQAGDDHDDPRRGRDGREVQGSSRPWPSSAPR